MSKLFPEFLPTGTVVEYQVLASNVKRVSVLYLMQNGPRSWCFAHDDPEHVYEPRYINIDHITAIIARGQGAVTILEPNPYPNSPFVYEQRGNLNEYELFHFVISVVNGINTAGPVDTDELLNSIRKSGINLTCKKKVKRWCRQNVNRFITSKRQMDIVDKHDQEEAYDDMDQYFPETGTFKYRNRPYTFSDIYDGCLAVKHYGILSKDQIDRYTKYGNDFIKVKVTASNSVNGDIADTICFATDVEGWAKTAVTKYGVFEYDIVSDFGDDPVLYSESDLLDFLNNYYIQ